jgi:hypothetical protein
VIRLAGGGESEGKLMPNVSARDRAGSAFLFAGAALALHVDPAVAGGFAPREQSAQFQGTSWAGSAAGGGLSSMFWNPAAATFVRHGIAVETHAALILPDSEITILPGSTTGGIGTTTDIGVEAFVPSSYMAWRMDPRTVLGVSLNSPYGLTTKPDDPNWGGAFHARTSKLFSFNVTPTVAYQVLPTLAIGAGVQFELFDLAALKSRSLANPAFTSDLEGNHVGIGWWRLRALADPLADTAPRPAPRQRPHLGEHRRHLAGVGAVSSASRGGGVERGHRLRQHEMEVRCA